MVILCEELSDILSMDGFNMTARSGIFAQSGIALLDRVSHTGNQRRMESTSANLLVARTDLDISQVSDCFLFPFI